MEEIKITELHESTIDSIKKTSEFFVYEEGCCHRNSLEIYTGDIIESLFSKIGYTITSRSIVKGFAVVIDDNIVFPHIWNAFSISKDDVVSTEYIDITKALFFNDKDVRYYIIKNYDVDTLERNNENGSVFSVETKEMAQKFASENYLNYKEQQ